MSKPWKTKEERSAEMEEITKQLEEGVQQYFNLHAYICSSAHYLRRE